MITWLDNHNDDKIDDNFLPVVVVSQHLAQSKNSSAQISKYKREALFGSYSSCYHAFASHNNMSGGEMMILKTDMS